MARTVTSVTTVLLASAFWLVKTEPDVFSYDDLERLGTAGWDGVRNYQARNHLRAMKRGDLVLVYHSNASPPGVAGVAEVLDEHSPDPTQFDPSSKYFDPDSAPDAPRWSWVHLAARNRLGFVTLDDLRTLPELASSRLLAKGNRLSVVPITPIEYEAVILRAGRTC